MSLPDKGRDRRRDTQLRILDAAERLFGRHGVAGVSMRQIGVEAAASNHFAVQYHFDDKAGLVKAIFERRLPVLDERRAELLSEFQKAGRLHDVRALVEVMLRPIAEARDSQGRRSFAAFVLGLRWFEDSFQPHRDAWWPGPLSRHVGELLRAAVPDLPDALYHDRMANASFLFLSAVMRLDHQERDGARPLLPEAETYRDALDQATAALSAPVSDAVRAAASVAAEPGETVAVIGPPAERRLGGAGAL